MTAPLIIVPKLFATPLDDAILASLVCVCPGSPRAKEGELHPPCSTGL